MLLAAVVLVFTNFSDIRITSADSGIVKTDAYHPHLVIDILLPTVTTARSYEYSYFKFAYRDYTLLYNILSTHDRLCV
jgi:hypothetical protein